MVKKLAENTGFIHKIAVLGKDWYSIAGIDNLFIYAGANRNWWKEPSNDAELRSQRMHRVYGWIDGLKVNAPDQVDKILAGVAQQIVDNENIPQDDRDFLIRFVNQPTIHGSVFPSIPADGIVIPDDAERLLEYLINGLPRAMHPLKFRREGLTHLEFDNEYDVQSLLHALFRPWIKDVRSEEYTPSYAGSSTRIDFVLTKYSIVSEVKFVRDRKHAVKIGDELIIDIAHYRVHPVCKQLWIVIYDPHNFIQNPGGLISDLEKHTEMLKIRVFVLGTS